MSPMLRRLISRVQERRQAVGGARAIINQTPALLDQITQRARLFIVRAPGCESLAMMLQEVEQIVGVCRIVFAQRRRKGLAILGQGRWVDGIKHEEVVLQQSVDQWA